MAQAPVKPHAPVKKPAAVAKPKPQGPKVRVASPKSKVIVQKVYGRRYV